jgi:hypothetical protein
MSEPKTNREIELSMIKLSNSIDNLHLELKQQKKDFEDLVTAIKEHQEKMDPIYLWFTNVNFFKKTLMWILSLVAALGGVFLVIKQIFFKS